MAEDDMRFCSNCKRHIAAGNYLMHNVHCQRNIGLCSKCNEPVPHKSMVEHLEEFHRNICCPKCSEKMERWMLEDHQEQSCVKRVKKCKYCELGCHMDELNEHEIYCGSRTEPCESCRKLVMTKDIESHTKFECGLENNYQAALLNNATSLYGKSNIAKKENNNHIKLPVCFSSMIETDSAGSPPKQTNIKPQINIDSSIPVKSLSKLSISDLEPPQTRLQYDSPSSVDEDDDLQAALALSMITAQEDYQQEDTEDKNNSDLSRDYPGANLVSLPCEFCGLLIPSEILILHQTGCRPDLLRSFPEMIREEPAALQNDKLMRRNLPDEVLESVAQEVNPAEMMEACIPCEVCKEIFPLDCFEDHQQICFHKEASSDSEDNTKQYSKRGSRFRPIKNPKDEIKEKRNESAPLEALPCEFCGDLFPTDVLEIHQSICDSNNYVSLGSDKTYPKTYSQPVTPANLESNTNDEARPPLVRKICSASVPSSELKHINAEKALPVRKVLPKQQRLSRKRVDIRPKASSASNEEPGRRKKEEKSSLNTANSFDGYLKNDCLAAKSNSNGKLHKNKYSQQYLESLNGRELLNSDRKFFNVENRQLQSSFLGETNLRQWQRKSPDQTERKTANTDVQPKNKYSGRQIFPNSDLGINNNSSRNHTVSDSLSLRSDLCPQGAKKLSSNLSLMEKNVGAHQQQSRNQLWNKGVFYSPEGISCRNPEDYYNVHSRQASKGTFASNSTLNEAASLPNAQRSRVLNQTKLNAAKQFSDSPEDTDNLTSAQGASKKENGRRGSPSGAIPRT